MLLKRGNIGKKRRQKRRQAIRENSIAHYSGETNKKENRYSTNFQKEEGEMGGFCGQEKRKRTMQLKTTRFSEGKKYGRRWHR